MIANAKTSGEEIANWETRVMELEFGMWQRSGGLETL